MEIMISLNGKLQIKRAGNFKLQFCPYNHGTQIIMDMGDSEPSDESTERWCGDSCPMFDEPIINKMDGRIFLNICNKEFVIESEKFIDRRI